MQSILCSAYISQKPSYESKKKDVTFLCLTRENVSASLKAYIRLRKMEFFGNNHNAYYGAAAERIKQNLTKRLKMLGKGTWAEKTFGRIDAKLMSFAGEEYAATIGRKNVENAIATQHSLVEKLYDGALLNAEMIESANHFYNGKDEKNVFKNETIYFVIQVQGLEKKIEDYNKELEILTAILPFQRRLIVKDTCKEHNKDDKRMEQQRKSLRYAFSVLEGYFQRNELVNRLNRFRVSLAQQLL
ncbi:MAG: hypothetical protein QXK37_02775 [Candidatus Woesearchaeota archaeon]